MLGTSLLSFEQPALWRAPHHFQGCFATDASQVHDRCAWPAALLTSLNAANPQHVHGSVLPGAWVMLTD